MSIGAAIAGAATSFGLNKLFGGGGGTVPAYGTINIPGVEFQPFTYTGSGGFGVTGKKSGEYGYDWSADIPDWLTNLGELGASQVGGLFGRYALESQKDPYAAADEFYQRGLTTLQPQLARQQIQAQERMFGGGRLGLQLAGEAVGAPTGTGQVNPDAYGLAAGQANMLQDLYTKSLSAGQQMQTQYLNQLSSAAAKMLELGMKPNEVEQALIEFGADLEGARSAARKQGVVASPLKESQQSVLSANLANTIGQGVADWWSQPTPQPTYNQVVSGFGSPTASQWYNNAAATGNLFGNNFGYGQNNSLMTQSQPITNYTPSSYSSGAMVYTP